MTHMADTRADRRPETAVPEEEASEPGGESTWAPV